MQGINRKDVILELVGKKFSRLTVTDAAWKKFTMGNLRVAVCRCDCGKVCIAKKRDLVDGSKKSCGCLRRELIAIHYKREQRIIVDGYATTDHPLRGSYMSMKQRCFNPSNNAWKNYGGRGITVCELWLGKGGFARFLSDVGPKPSLKHTIHRIDNDGNYEPGNVCWATIDVQHSNRRKITPKYLKTCTNDELLEEVRKRGLVIVDFSCAI